MGVAGLLTSKVFGLKRTIAREVQEKLDKHYLLLGKKSKSEDDEAELMRLAAELNDLYVARTYPNPYFEQFACAMARRHGTELMDAMYDGKEIEAQARLADEVLKEVLAEERMVEKGGRK
jgi:protoheme ferro-lyase